MKGILRLIQEQLLQVFHDEHNDNVDVKIKFGFKGAKLIDNDYYFPIHVKILGKSNKEEIRNIGEVVAINGENASEKIDFEVIN